MSTRSCVIIKVRVDDIGQAMRFDKELLPVEEKGWEDYNEDDVDKSTVVKIKCVYLGVYCHWDGYPDGVGAALKNKFKTYEQALNLVLGGDCSVISEEYVKRYATRKGEQWDEPTQSNNVNNVVAKFDWSEYAYLFTDEHGWQVDDFGGGSFKDF